MSFLDWFTSTPKVVDNVFDKDNGLLTQAGQFIGHQQYTDQEKQEDQKELVKSVQSFVVATLNENTDRSKTRRRMAEKWFEMQLWLIKLQVVCFFVDKFTLAVAEKSFNLSGDFSQIAFNQAIWAVTSGIGLFFWGSHALRSSKFSK